MKRIGMTVLAGFLIGSLPLTAVPLDELLQGAKENSPILQMYELNRESGELSLEESAKKTTVSVDTSSTYTQMALTTGGVDENVLTGTVDVTLGFPTDNATTLTVSPGTILYSLDSGAFGASPSLSLSHAFSSLDNGDTLQDLQDSKSALQNEYLYRNNVSSFTQSVYSSLSGILSYEKNLLSVKQDIADLETSMANMLALGDYSKESSIYLGYELQLSALKRSRTTSEKQLALAQVQFTQLTGLEYQELDDISFPTLSFTPLASGNSEVILSELDLEIAREQVNLLGRQTVASGSGWTVPSFAITGNADLDYVNTGTSSVGYSFSGGGSYTGKGFSANALVGLDVASSGARTPTVTIGGSWSSADTESRSIQERLYDNALSTAELTYAQDLLTYQIDAQTLANDILSWQSESAEFSLTLEYHQGQLEILQEGLSLGLNTEKEVTDAVNTLALDDYEQKILALEGLVLAEQISQMQF